MSFSDGISLQHGDVMRVGFSGFGRPLRNPVAVERGPEALVAARPL